MSGVSGRRGDGTILVRVTAAPEEGRANEMALAVLREALGVPRHAVRLVSGGSAREKWVEVDGLDRADVEQRLREEP